MNLMSAKTLKGRLGSPYRLVTLAILMALLVGTVAPAAQLPSSKQAKQQPRLTLPQLVKATENSQGENLILPVSNVATPESEQQPDLTKRSPKPGTAVLTNTWVRAVRVNEVQGKKSFTEIRINEPEMWRFEWGTKAVASEEGFWRLVRIGPRRDQEALLASGVSQPGSGGIFFIDLRQFLPPKPPTPSIVYHVQVIPRRKAKSDKSTTTSPGQAGAKVPAATIGAWSPPVVITYAGAPASPGVTFDFPEVYRQAKLVVDGFRVVQDQMGAGKEEYHISGFIQELFWSPDDGGKFNRPGRVIKIGPYERAMNPPMTTTLEFGPYGQQQTSWKLVLNTEQDKWPRRLAVVISVMEEDGGSEIGDWQKGVNGMQEFVKLPGALNRSKNQLLDYARDHGFDGVKFLLDAANAIYAVATKGASVAGPVMIAGTFVALAVIGAWAIWADSADDYYGTGAGVTTIKSNRVDEVHKLPGTLKGSGNNTTYVLKPQTLQFKGPPGATQAAAFDGIVEFTYHWEFSERALK